MIIVIVYGCLVFYILELHTQIKKTEKALSKTQYFCNVASSADSEHQFLLDELERKRKKGGNNV